MAVAAYASVLSLLRVIDNIQLPSHLRLFPDSIQLIDALREKLCFLQEFLELHSSTISKDIELVVRRVPEVASDIESTIDKYVVDQLYKELYPQNDTAGSNIDSIRDEIHRVIQEITPINKALKTMKDTRLDQEQEQPRIMSKKITGNKPLPNDYLLAFSGEKNKMVGFEDQLHQVLKKLTCNQPNLEVVPIVGMGGIGKTTLARSVFDHPYNLHHFHVRIWLTISQDYSVKKVLQGLLRDGVIGEKKDRELGGESEAELITQLYQKLFGQRYLIVLDDVWSAEAWDDLRRGFPDNGKGSRVMVTTRLYDIASSLGSENNSYSMKFLNEDESWDLFSEKAFEKGGRSRELEKIGRGISKRCKGLPLLLVLIGGLLANSNMTVEYWQTVKENINLLATSANDEYCLRVLSLSYNHLPIHLKPCFLYMRHFEEDSRVKVSELIKKWVSQGFVRPMRGKTLEEAARRYLEDLVGRNMLLIRERCKKGQIKFCGIHDILRDLCIKESNKEQLCDVSRILLVAHFSRCYLCKEPRTEEMLLLSEIFAGSEFRKTSMCISCMNRLPEFGRSRFAMAVKTNSQNIQVMTRYRQLSIGRYVGWSLVVLHAIRLLWNLECLQIGYGSLPFISVMPKEIWEMPQLRHMISDDEFRLPDLVSASKNNAIVLANMQTIKILKNFKCTEEIVRRIPNLRKLGLRYNGFATDEEKELSSYYLQNLAHLQKLESLAIYCSRSFSVDVKKDIAFPRSLTKLSLGGCQIAWDDLAIISDSSLPNLQVLKLWWKSVSGEEWNPIEGESLLSFHRLKYLKLQRLDLVCWRAVHEFPDLETLVIRDMRDLEAIPREIGELPSLNSIYLSGYSKNVVDSAKVILEEQLSNGNDQLVVYIKDSSQSTYQVVGANRVG